MPLLIRDGRIVADDWDGQMLSLEELNSGQADLNDKDTRPLGVTLTAGQPPATIGVELERLALIAIHFPVFTDGRGFSYARELRERGFTGEIRATGHFIRDQMAYLKRCGCNAFALNDDMDAAACLDSLGAISETYQADAEQALPWFRRR